ncbi:response regulator [uncultured Algimonas sp.]|uniref:response regulator n=1 Tax=uncultured Algimonas sp. TaxID=1547920 RepID=UPI00260C86D6|nr:response regulator [uncultured Algimonas sp.]
MTDRPQRIFIVEDEVIVAFEMADILEDLGFEVVGPSIHLDHAKKTAKEQDIDIAFLDVNLGSGKTSKPVVEILKDRDIPYVFITAYNKDHVEFIDSEDRVLRKPVTGDTLLQTLRRLYPKLER